MLHEQRVQVLATGKASRTRYALRKPLRGDAADVPLYEVGVDGQANALAPLALVYPQGSRMDLSGSAWPLVDASRDGWWDGLPYPIYDMCPQGHLGRQMARAHHRPWAVSSNPDEWSDDHIVYVISHSGHDVSGNLILGDPAFEAWQRGKLDPPVPIKARAMARAYAGLAEEAVAAGVAGSSVAGEFPKFPALRERAGSATAHVLVKFSGADGSPSVHVLWWFGRLIANTDMHTGNLSLRPGLHPNASASQPPRAPEPGAGLRHAAHAVRALHHGAASNRHYPCRRSARTG